jgi:anti-sigma factor RsiW
MPAEASENEMRVPRRGEPREEELAGLADGSVSDARRATLEARVAESPELALRLAEQEHAVALVRGAAAEVEAPAALRARIESRRPTRTLRSRSLALGGGVALAAAALLLLVIALPTGAGGPTVAEAAALTTMPATAPAPPVLDANPKLLDEAVGEIPFPNWLEKFGWRATGVRTDTIDGRDATTVFYEKDGRRLGYTIVAGEALDVPAGAERTRREGVELALLRVDGRDVVTWQRGEMTCVLAGDVTDEATLEKLAAWRGQGEVPF